MLKRFIEVEFTYDMNVSVLVDGDGDEAIVSITTWGMSFELTASYGNDAWELYGGDGDGAYEISEVLHLALAAAASQLRDARETMS